MATTSAAHETAAPLQRTSSASTLGPPSSQNSIHDGEADSKPQSRQVQFLRILSFVSSVLSALCAGSATVFSLYGPLFQSQLHLSQYQINGIASSMSLALYIPVPIVGYAIDRIGPGPVSSVSVILLGGGYGFAAYLYKNALLEVNLNGRVNAGLFPALVVAFAAVGLGTATLYVSAIATCAKNFGKSKYRGIMLVAPIASFGLSGMVLSQIATRLLSEKLPDGRMGPIDVFRFFLFLSILLAVVSVFAAFALRIVNEEELIDEAVDELERSGLLEGSAVFRQRRRYGTLDETEEDAEDANLLDPRKDDEEANQSKLLKAWLLNAETRSFLTDHTTWWFALGFWLVIGPGEQFLNNMGTVIGTLYPPGSIHPDISAATHVSIIAAVSTVARLVVGMLSDLISPSPQGQHIQTGYNSTLAVIQKKFSTSRISMMIAAGLILSSGTLILASGAVQNHGERFWLVSGAIGTGYGAVFSLLPITVTLIWGAENFGTNFGIVALFPAVGALMWGLIYAAVYQAGANNSGPSADGGSNEDRLCYGTQCYAPAYWGMTVSIWVGCLMIFWAWKGIGGWAKRGIIV